MTWDEWCAGAIHSERVQRSCDKGVRDKDTGAAKIGQQ